jgi:hypothetical protein
MNLNPLLRALQAVAYVTCGLFTPPSSPPPTFPLTLRSSILTSCSFTSTLVVLFGMLTTGERLQKPLKPPGNQCRLRLIKIVFTPLKSKETSILSRCRYHVVKLGWDWKGNSIKKYNQVTDYSRTERVTTASRYCLDSYYDTERRAKLRHKLQP